MNWSSELRILFPVKSQMKEITGEDIFIVVGVICSVFHFLWVNRNPFSVTRQKRDQFRNKRKCLLNYRRFLRNVRRNDLHGFLGHKFLLQNEILYVETLQCFHTMFPRHTLSHVYAKVRNHSQNDDIIQGLLSWYIITLQPLPRTPNAQQVFFDIRKGQSFRQ